MVVRLPSGDYDLEVMLLRLRSRGYGLNINGLDITVLTLRPPTTCEPSLTFIALPFTHSLQSFRPSLVPVLSKIGSGIELL